MTCEFVQHTMNIEMAPGAVVIVKRTARGGIVVNHEGCAHPCRVPDVWNTERIRIHGGDGDQKVYIKLDDGGFAPGYSDEQGDTDEIGLTVLLGKGADTTAWSGPTARAATRFAAATPTTRARGTAAIRRRTAKPDPSGAIAAAARHPNTVSSGP